MKKIVLLSVFAAALFFVSVLLLCQFYLPGVNYYQPINVKIEGLTSEQIKQVKVYGITPLSNAPKIINTALTDTNKSVGLFRQVYISFSDTPLDSVSVITVSHGSDVFVFDKNEVARLIDTKSATFWLPQRTKKTANKTAKFSALISGLFHLQMVGMVLIPLLLLLLAAAVAVIQKNMRRG